MVSTDQIFESLLQLIELDLIVDALLLNFFDA